MLSTVEPLISEEEFIELKNDMDEFQKGDGQKLHKILQTRWKYQLLLKDWCISVNTTQLNWTVRFYKL